VEEDARIVDEKWVEQVADLELGGKRLCALERNPERDGELGQL
jgi:hypothetical protein